MCRLHVCDFKIAQHILQIAHIEKLCTAVILCGCRYVRYGVSGSVPSVETDIKLL